MELGLEHLSANLLLLGEDSKGKRQDGKRSEGNETQVKTEGNALGQLGSSSHPLLLHEVLIPSLLVLDVVEHHGGDDHDGATGEDSAGGSLVDGNPGCGMRLAQRGNVPLRLALGLELGLVLLGEHRPDVDALDDLVAAHEVGVEAGGRGDGGKGDQAAEDVAGRGGDVEARDEGVEAQGDGARGADGREIRLDHDLGGHGRRLVGVGRVESDVEGLVEDLPPDDAHHAEAGLEHAGRDHQVGQDVAGHSEGEQDRLAGIYNTPRVQIC